MKKQKEHKNVDMHTAIPVLGNFNYPILFSLNNVLGRDPFKQNFRKFWSKTQCISSVQPEKFQKNGSTFLRWTTFPGRTGWYFG